jgi:hypothetical protein
MKDFALDDNGDMLIVNGDFAIEEGESQHLEDMLLCPAGGWITDPLLGIGLRKFYKGANSQSLLDKLESDLRLQLKYDNWEVNTIGVFSLNNIIINANKK